MIKIIPTNIANKASAAMDNQNGFVIHRQLQVLLFFSNIGNTFQLLILL